MPAASCLPPIVRRSHRLTRVLGAIVLYWFVAYVVLRTVTAGFPRSTGASGGRLRTLFLLLIGPYLLFGAYWLWTVKRGPAARLRRRMGESRFCLCGHCGQNLRGLATRGRCPECGTAYDAERLRRFWRRWARLPLRGRLALQYGRWNPWPFRIGAIVMSLVVLSWMSGGSRWSPWTVVFALPVIGAIWMYVWNHEYVDGLTARATVAEDVDLAGGLLCARCGWILSERDPVGRCPACRKPYEFEALRAHWAEECPPHWELHMRGVEASLDAAAPEAE